MRKPLSFPQSQLKWACRVRNVGGRGRVNRTGDIGQESTFAPEEPLDLPSVSRSLIWIFLVIWVVSLTYGSH